MKKVLLATLLTITAASFTITATTTKNILIELKTIKPKLQNILKNMDEESNILAQEYGPEHYQEAINICRTLYTIGSEKLSFEEPNNSYKFLYDYECLQHLNQLTTEAFECSIMYLCPLIHTDLLANELLPNHIETIKSFLIKYEEPNSTFTTTEHLLDYFYDVEDNWVIMTIICEKKYINSLLSHIDNIIKTLETKL